MSHSSCCTTLTKKKKESSKENPVHPANTTTKKREKKKTSMKKKTAGEKSLESVNGVFSNVHVPQPAEEHSTTNGRQAYRYLTIAPGAYQKRVKRKKKYIAQVSKDIN